MKLIIPKCKVACCTCSERFEAGQEVFSALFDGEDEFLRRDYCPACWTGAHPSDAILSYWRFEASDTKTPKAKPEAKGGDRGLLAYTVQLLESEGALERAYLLAHYLERKGLLRRCRTPREATQVIFEQVDSGEALVFPAEKVRGLPLAEIEPVVAKKIDEAYRKVAHGQDGYGDNGID